jgi:hypothetical protein
MMSTRSRSPETSRRGFLAGAGLAVLGAGAGVAVGLLRHRTADQAEVPDPQTLLAAARAERELMGSLDAELAGQSSPRPLLRQVRADHAAHLAALTAAVAAANGGAPSGSPTAPPPPSTAPGRDALRQAEVAAAGAAARRALVVTGRDAALLASISACEATHAELLG